MKKNIFLVKNAGKGSSMQIPVRQNTKVKTDQEVCNVCSKPFKFKTTLKNHMKKVHGIESLENGNDIEGPEKPFLC